MCDQNAPYQQLQSLIASPTLAEVLSVKPYGEYRPSSVPATRATAHIYQQYDPVEVARCEQAWKQYYEDLGRCYASRAALEALLSSLTQKPADCTSATEVPRVAQQLSYSGYFCASSHTSERPETFAGVGASSGGTPALRSEDSASSAKMDGQPSALRNFSRSLLSAAELRPRASSAVCGDHLPSSAYSAANTDSEIPHAHSYIAHFATEPAYCRLKCSLSDTDVRRDGRVDVVDDSCDQQVDGANTLAQQTVPYSKKENYRAPVGASAPTSREPRHTALSANDDALFQMLYANVVAESPGTGGLEDGCLDDDSSRGDADSHSSNHVGDGCKSRKRARGNFGARQNVLGAYERGTALEEGREREPEWRCLHCARSNYATRRKCRRCGIRRAVHELGLTTIAHYNAPY